MNPKPYIEAFGILAFVALALYLFKDLWLPFVFVTLLTIVVLAVTRKK